MDPIQLLLRVCEEVDTPVSLGIYIRTKNGALGDVLGMRANPDSYTDPQRFLLDRIPIDLLRKCRDLLPNNKLREQAITNFYLAEDQCLETNHRFSLLEPEVQWTVGDTPIGRFVRQVKKEVERMIGARPNLSFIEANARFGPGATFESVGKLSTIADKIDNVPTCTDPRILATFPGFFETWWHRANPKSMACVFVNGNRFTTVPKDSKTDRGISIEPSINLYYQLGVGKLLRHRILKSTGIDLLTAQDGHRKMAETGSRTGSLATIDLSMASDTLAAKVVEILLPRPWYELLDSLRSRSTFIEGSWHLNRKFSSMGNGFTFELETLIFLAIARVITRRHGLEDWVSCFGDDIIVPTEAFNDVVSALKYFGFTPNPAKSFGSGLFRESCGGDFFAGQDVRPIYVKKSPNEPHELVTLANQLFHLSRKALVAGRFAKVRDWVLFQVPKHIRDCRGPSCLGDIVVHDISWDFRERHGIRWLKCYKPIPLRVGLKYFRPDTQLAAALYGGCDGLTSSVNARGVSGYRLGRVAYS